MDIAAFIVPLFNHFGWIIVQMRGCFYCAGGFHDGLSLLGWDIYVRLILDFQALQGQVALCFLVFAQVPY